MVKTSQGLTEEYRTRKGIRQECAMSPLFNLYMADIDEEIEKRTGDIEIGRIRVWNLAYMI